MTCYDEEYGSRRNDNLPPVVPDRHGPTVVRDRQNVREIAADPAAFALHVRPRFKQGRDDDYGPHED
jgi:hypothetical protein